MSIIKGIKVGTTTITSTYTDGVSQSDSAEFEVIAVGLGSISTPEDTTYDGTNQEPYVRVTAMVDGVSTELTYGTDYLLTYSNNTNKGQATVTATGIGNFTGSLSAHWNILGADMTVIASDQSYTYDGLMHGNPISVTTVNNQTPTIKYRTTSSGSYNLSTAPQFKNVVNSGYNNIVYFQVTAPNHNTYEGSYHLEIYPKTATLAWGTLNWVYDGQEHHTTCEVSNLESGDSCVVTLSNNSITTTSQSPVTVTATALSNSNYALPSNVNDRRVQITVSPGMFVKLSGTWTPVKEVYRKVSGAWVKQEFGNAFNTAERYVRKN